MTSQADPNRRILIVDDNTAIHDVFQKILGAPASTAKLEDLEAVLFSQPGAATNVRSSFELDSAYQGREALERVTVANAAARPYAVAFVDMRMPPGWDGLETIEHLWRADPFLQVIICSAYADHSWEDVRARLGERDALLIIKKPFDPIEIIQGAHALTAKWTLAWRLRSHVEKLEETVRMRMTELDHLRVVREGMKTLARMTMAMQNASRSHTGSSQDPGIGAQLVAIAEEADLARLGEELPRALDRIQEAVEHAATIAEALKDLAHRSSRDAAPPHRDHRLDDVLQTGSSRR